MRYFYPSLFFVSLVIGLFIIYNSAPQKNVITVYPTPDNYNSYQYQDNANNCFLIKQNVMPCPKNKKYIITVPIQ